MTLDPALSDTQLLEIARKRGARVAPVTPALPGSAAPAHTAVTLMPAPAEGARGTGEDPKRRGMNKTERRYADHLELLVTAGVVVWWAYEAIKLRLADDAFFTADFAVMRCDGLFELIDVKGRKGDSYYATEDSRLKIRFVAAHYPFHVRVAWETSRDMWTHHSFSPAES